MRGGGLRDGLERSAARAGRRGLVALPLLALAAAGRAQPPVDRSFTETVDVTVIEVEVHVTDRRGHPVAGLERGDFTLYEDGKRVKITNFLAVDREAARAAAAAGRAPAAARDLALPAPTEDDPRVFLALFLDELHIRPHNRNRLYRQIDEFLTARDAATDFVMVASYERAFEVEQPFSRDPAEVGATLARLLGESSAGQQEDSRWRSTLQMLRTLYDLGWRECGDPCRCKKAEMVAVAEVYGAEVRGEVEASLRSVGELINSLAGLPGRRSVLYVGDGLPLAGGEELFALIDDWCPLGSTPGGLPSGSTAFERGGSFSSREVLDRLTAHANRNEVVLYTLQSAGLPVHLHTRVDSDLVANTPRAPGGGIQMATFDQVRRSNLQHTLSAMAADTGGLAFLDINDFRGSLEKMDRDFDHYYSLGYVPRRPLDARPHEIEVRVKRKGVRVRHRRSHRDMSSFDLMANRTTGALWYRFDHNPMRIKVSMGKISEADEGAYSLPLLLQVPLDSVLLLRQGEEFAGQLSLFFAAEGPDGRKAPPVHTAVPIRVPLADFLQAHGKRVEHPVALTLAGGENRLAIGVWDEVSRNYSVLYREVDVPGWAPAEGSG